MWAAFGMLAEPRLASLMGQAYGGCLDVFFFTSPCCHGKKKQRLPMLEMLLRAGDRL